MVRGIERSGTLGRVSVSRWNSFVEQDISRFSLNNGGVRIRMAHKARALTTTSFGSALVMRLSSQYSHLPRDLTNEVSSASHSQFHG